MRKLLTLAAMIGPAMILSCTHLQADEHDRKLTLDQLPAPVRATAEKQAIGGTIGEIEMETEKGETTYIVDVKQNGVLYDVEIAPGGQLLSKKIDTEDGEQADNHGDERDGD